MTKWAPTEQSLSGRGKKEVMAESLIRQRVEELAKAIRAKNIDGVMSFYAPDIVSFDIGPPLTDYLRRLHALRNVGAHPGGG